MATETLRAMALGGMRDHVGGGFHRYSVDGDWRVPHFEKMLYDQAQLVLAYLEAAQATGDDVLRRGRGGHAGLRAARHDRPARRLLFRRGRRQHSAGAGRRRPARTSRRARSTSGRDDEIGALLGDDADDRRRRFGIEPAGNAPQDPQGEFTGKNLLYIGAVDRRGRDARTGKSADDVLDAPLAAPAIACLPPAAGGHARISTTRS